MGFLSSLSRKLAKAGTAQSDVDAIEPETGESLIAPHRGIPPDVLRLLWFRDGPLKNIPDEELNKNTMDFGGFSIHISFKGAIEPSAIGMTDRIRRPSDIETVERPSYYPEYAQLSPEQRWVYLDWLKNVGSSTNIGYVFIFYYGLERHMFFGDYEDAFNMVLRLRSTHKNGSFVSYSSTAVILSCMLHNRADLFRTFLDTISDIHELRVSPLYLVAKRALGMRLLAPEIISLAGMVDFRPRTYIDDQRNIFQTQLKSLLDKIYDGGLDMKKFHPDECPYKKILVAANFSLPTEQRSIDVPDISLHPEFRKEVLELLQQTHEHVKQELRRIRGTGGLVPVEEVLTQNPAREPDFVFKGGQLFNAIDVHMFDRNLMCFNKSSCPYCGKPLTKRPARKGKCNECGNTILGKHSVFTGERLLMTEEDSAAMAIVAEEKSRRKHIEQVIEYERLNTQRIVQRMAQKGASVEEVVLEEIIESFEGHKNGSKLGLARNSLLMAGELLEGVGKPEKALGFYLAVFYYDVNGAQNTPRRFNSDFALLAPGVLSMIRNIAEKVGIGADGLKNRFIEAAEEWRAADMPLSPISAWSKLDQELLRSQVLPMQNTSLETQI